MYEIAVDTPSWRRASRCSGNSDCVEVSLEADSVLIRDSKLPRRGPMRFSRQEWIAFVAGAKAGEFDLAGDTTPPAWRAS